MSKPAFSTREVEKMRRETPFPNQKYAPYTPAGMRRRSASIEAMLQNQQRLKNQGKYYLSDMTPYASANKEYYDVTRRSAQVAEFAERKRQDLVKRGINPPSPIRPGYSVNEKLRGITTESSVSKTIERRAKPALPAGGTFG